MKYYSVKEYAIAFRPKGEQTKVKQKNQTKEIYPQSGSKLFLSYTLNINKFSMLIPINILLKSNVYLRILFSLFFDAIRLEDLLS